MWEKGTTVLDRQFMHVANLWKMPHSCKKHHVRKIGRWLRRTDRAGGVGRAGWIRRTQFLLPDNQLGKKVNCEPIRGNLVPKSWIHGPKYGVQRLWVIWGQCCPRVAAAPSLPNGPITQFKFSPYFTRKPGISVLDNSNVKFEQIAG